MNMTRRQLLALAGVYASMASVTTAARTSGMSAKKGLCLSAKKRSPQKVARFLETIGARWIYNWNVEPPEILPVDVDFIPMIYRGGEGTIRDLAKLESKPPLQQYAALLGFNEPDAKSQGNTSVEDALDSWPKLEATGLRLGSPACVHPDNDWMKAFMKGVDQRGLRVDFICVHSYGGPGADSLVRRLEKVHSLYKRPIWITEFAVADWEAKSATQNRHKPEKIADFVSQVIPRLEAMDIVERYAWFHGGVSGTALATSKLFNPDGSPTLVGEAYRDALP